MTRYVCGFLIDTSTNTLLLIERKKQDWQQNRINGIGGKIISGELSYTAMVREFKEEAGMEVNEWLHIVTLINIYRDWVVDFFICAIALSVCQVVFILSHHV